MARKIGTTIEGTINHVELREARHAMSFTEEYVCLQANIDRRTLYNYEMGVGRTNFKTLEEIAKVYDMQAEDFLTPVSMVMLGRIEAALYKYTEDMDLGNNHIAALGWFDRLAPLVQVRHDREMAAHEEEVLRLQVELEKTRKETAALELKNREVRGQLFPSGVDEDGRNGKETDVESVQESEIVSIREFESPEGEE